MRIGVPREVSSGERRVALVPDSVKRLVAKGLEVVVEKEAAAEAGYADAAYEEAGARLEADVAELWGTSDFVAKIQAPTDHPRHSSFCSIVQRFVR